METETTGKIIATKKVATDTLNQALVLVDIQNDFCPGGALAVPEGDQVIIPLNKLIEHAKKSEWVIVATRDWHPTKTTHFKDYGGVWPVHCVQNTEGAKFHPALNIEGVAVFSKGMGASEDAYSGFDARNDDGLFLEQILKELRVGKVYVGGLATDYCVKATALDAALKGFATHLLTDASRAVNLQPDDEKKAIAEMVKAGVKLATTERSVN